MVLNRLCFVRADFEYSEDSVVVSDNLITSESLTQYAVIIRRTYQRVFCIPHFIYQSRPR